MNILFSIVVPSYNRAHLIPVLLESLLKQEYSNFEVIVVDDGGSDNTKEIVEKYNEPRFKYYYKKNEERGAARNFGAKIATGTYVNFFDSDDVAYPNHLSVASQLAEREHTPEIFHTGFDIVSPEGKTIYVMNNFFGNIKEDYVKAKRVSINSLFVRKDIALAIPFSEIRALSASEDAVFLCQLVSRYPMKIDNTVTTAIIDHRLRSTAVAGEAQLQERRKYMIRELTNDKIFMQKFGSCVRNIDTEMLYLIAFACLFERKKRKGLKYFFLFLKRRPLQFFTIRTLAVIKWLFK